MEEEDALEEAFLVVAFRTLGALEVALNAVEVAFHMDPLGEVLVDGLHTS